MIRYNLAGIAVNLFLAVFKLIVGHLCHSHVVMLDSVNSISDVLSYSLSILSVYLGKRKADEEHPLGFGRFEYLFSLLITGIIVAVGVRSIIDSIISIFNPHEAPNYNATLIILMVISFLFKLVFGYLNKKKGEEIGSAAMIMSGSESLGDALTSAAVLLAILIIRITGLDVEHYLCIAVSLLIIYTGIGILKECTNKILGTKADPEFKKKIIKMIINEEEVLNVSNLVIHNYGEGVYVGSANIEVDENMNALRISEISRDIIKKAADLGLNLTSVGVSAANIHDKEAVAMYDNIISLAITYPGILRVHSFVVDFENKKMSFYIVQTDSKDNEKKRLLKQLQQIYPDFNIEIFMAIEM